jgi:GxxExxY protein
VLGSKTNAECAESTRKARKVDENDIGTMILGAAIKVHANLGPGLLESAYRTCLAYELEMAHLSVRQEVAVPIRYGNIAIQNGYRLDLLVAERVVVELKAQDAITPVHRAQLLSYLRLGGYKLGYLLNFNVTNVRSGIARLVNGASDLSASSAPIPRLPRSSLEQ